MGLEALLKKYKEAIALASQERPRDYFSLGPLSLNLAIGTPNGVPGGKMVQIVGRQSSGKSTLALDIIAQYQKKFEQPAVYIDFERSFDPRYATACGIDLRQLYIVRADTTEQGFNICEEAIDHDDTRLVVIDSVAAARPSSELNKDYEDNAKMASNAGILTRFCNRITPLLDNRGALIVALNQYRKNFSQMSPETEIPFGGMALAYSTQVLIALARIKTEAEVQTTQAIIKKNKTNAPQGRAEFKIIYGEGINHNQDVVDLAATLGIVEKSGAWFKYDKYKAQGAENAGKELPIEEIRQRIIAQAEETEQDGRVVDAA